MISTVAFMLGELEISNVTVVFLAIVSLVFVGSFAVVSWQTGELIKPPKDEQTDSLYMPTSPTSASAVAAAADGRLPPARPSHHEGGRRVHVRAQLSHLMGTSWNRQECICGWTPRASECGPLSDWRSAVGAELRCGRPRSEGLVAAATQRRVATAEANLAPDWDIQIGDM